MKTLRERVLTNLKERRNRVLEGKINCIPSPFERFSNDYVGLEQGCYYCITSSTKGAKSQFTSYTFIYSPLMYCYYHKDIDIDLKVLYFPLEETPERILQRFISWLLFEYSKGEIRISPRDLRSTTNAVSQEILDIIASDEIQDIIKFFEEHVLFYTEFNPTGIYKVCKQYAEENGKVYTKAGKYKDEFGNIQETQVFDRYEQNNPNEYRIIIVDTINLIDTERGLSLKQSMDKLSEYLAKYLRNRYNYSPVVIQQQAFSGEDNDSFKMGRVSPSVANLGDSKYISRDANLVIGLFSPFKFGLPEYKGYNIKKFRDNIRFVEILVSRDGEMGGILPLFFDGATCIFKELPLPNDGTTLDKWYAYLNKIRGLPNFGNTTNTLLLALSKNYIKNIGDSKIKRYLCTLFHKFN